MVRALIYLCSLLAPRRFRTAWREEWLAELHAARRSGGIRTFRLALGAPFDALSSRWTTDTQPGSRWQGPWRSDLLQTVRALRRAPGHVVVVALCLGVGIAVCTTTFSILNAFTAGELPGIRERARLARLHLSSGNSSVAEYETLRQGSPSFAGIAAEGRGPFAVRAGGQAPISVEGAFVSGNYFEVLGTNPAIGRLLYPSDDRPDAPLAVTISHAFWIGRLGAPADIVGKTIVVGGRDAIVTGVAPKGFVGLRGGEMNDNSGFAVYVPLAHASQWPGGKRLDQQWLNVYGRLTVPMDSDRLEAELLPLAGRLNAISDAMNGATSPDPQRNVRIDVTETWTTPSAEATAPLLVFLYLATLAAPLTVLAIGCANVANLQLVRASLRTRELAVRASLGASRGQIIRLLTFEAVLLVIAAFATSALGIWLLLRVATLVLPISVPLDTRVMMFATTLAMIVIGATGLLPGLISTRADASAHLRSGGRGLASGNSRLRRGLVVAQVTLCFLMLLTAGVFIHGLAMTTGATAPHAAHTLITQLRFDVLDKYVPAERQTFLERFEARMRADGRVRSIGYTSDGPIPGGVLRVWLAGDRPDAGKYSEAVYVAGDYFNIVGVRPLRGRALADAEASAPAVVVNEAFVTEFELSEPVLGQTVRIVHPAEKGTSARHVTIIGVVSEPASTAVNTPEDNDPRMYLPLGAVPGEISAWMSADNAAQVTDTVRRTLTDLDPELPILSVRTLEEAEAAGNEPLRQIARTAGGLGLVSLLLAVSGLYSVIAFFVALRTSEFGIRVALGAQSADIVRMVLAQALRLAGTGLALGTVLGIPLLIVLDKNFGFMQPFDTTVMGTTALVLALTALLAGWVPARRASRIHAAVALRAD